MSTSTERMRRLRAKLKLESQLLECLAVGLSPDVVLAEVRSTLRAARVAKLFVERHDDRGDGRLAA